MDKYIAKTVIKHNGNRYEVGSEIELEDATELLEAKAVKLITKTNPDNNKKGSTASDHEKGEGAGDNPPQPKPYEFMKDAEQVEYLTNLSDEDFKAQFTETFEKSKTQAKKFAKKRMNQLTENSESGTGDKNGSVATDPNQESSTSISAEV